MFKTNLTFRLIFETFKFCELERKKFCVFACISLFSFQLFSRSSRRVTGITKTFRFDNLFLVSQIIEMEVDKCDISMYAFYPGIKHY